MSSQNYQSERSRLNTDTGMAQVLRISDVARSLLRTAGAVRSDKLLSGDSWDCLNALDYLEEQGYLRLVSDREGTAGQHRVYVAGTKWGEL